MYLVKRFWGGHAPKPFLRAAYEYIFDSTQ